VSLEPVEVAGLELGLEELVGRAGHREVGVDHQHAVADRDERAAVVTGGVGIDVAERVIADQRDPGDAGALLGR
jgi:hypothetical protein